MLKIRILGAGCANCKRLEAETRAALDAAIIAYELDKVTDYDAIVAYGVLATPSLVMNEKVVSVGKIPARSQIVGWAREFEPIA
jgi:small redox-active disulfide protein 2